MLSPMPTTSSSSAAVVRPRRWRGRRGVMTKLGLTVNEAKTSLKDARQERFAFLGFSFGPHYPYNSKVRMHMSASPSKKSVQQLKTKVRELLVPKNTDPWPEVRDDLNRRLRGWSSYFNLD